MRPRRHATACSSALRSALLQTMSSTAIGHSSGSGRLFGIDHGLTFHTEEKLRTVLWNFAGLAIPEEMVRAIARLDAALGGPFAGRVTELVGPDETIALVARAGSLLADPRHPEPPYDRPAVPWPPY